MDVNAIKSRVKSIAPVKRLKIATISAAADKVLEATPWLVEEVQRLTLENEYLKALAHEDD